MAEIWRMVETHPDYEASSLGRVRRRTGGRGVRAGRVLRPLPNGPERRYAQVNLYRVGIATRITVHAIVARAFIGPRPAGMEINHLDGDRWNNAAANLEYCTSSENKRHAFAHGFTPVGGDSHSAKLSDGDVAELRRLYGSGGISQRELAQRFGVSQGHVSDIMQFRRRRMTPAMIEYAQRRAEAAFRAARNKTHPDTNGSRGNTGNADGAVAWHRAEDAKRVLDAHHAAAGAV